MYESSAIATSNALRAASYAVMRACKVASDAIQAMPPLPDDAATNGSKLELPFGSDNGALDGQSAAFRAVLETRRAYLLAISLATQINVGPATSATSSSRRTYLSGREYAQRLTRSRSTSRTVRTGTLHLVTDTDD